MSDGFTSGKGDDVFGEEEKIRQKKEWLYAELENRLRAMVTELLGPTLRKVSEQQLDLESLHSVNNDHAKKIQNMFSLQNKVVQTATTLEDFREDLSKMDMKVHQACTKCSDDVMTMQTEFQGLQKNLELKESAIFATQRSLDRCSAELNRILDNQNESMDAIVQEQIDEMRKSAHRMICELEAKIMGLELQQASFTDQLWGEETGLAKVCGEVKRSREALDEVSDAVRELQENRVQPEDLKTLRHEVKTCLSKAEEDMKALRGNVGNVVNDTQEHFRTALETVATQHACFMEEVRRKYRAELAQSAQLREDVEGHVAVLKANTANIEKRVEQAAVKADDHLQDQKNVMEESEKKRKRDRVALELEIKGIQKRLGGIFDSHAVVSKGFAHLGEILGFMLEAVRMQCAFELQDTSDREHMYLLGLREETAPKEPSPPTQSPGRAKICAQGSPRRTKVAAQKSQIVAVDQRCLSCSGQAPTVLSAFKTACLQYNPSPVNFQDTEHTRFDILHKIELSLQRAHEMYSEGPQGRAQREEVGHQSPGRTKRSNGGNGNGRLNIADYMPMSEGVTSKPVSQEKDARISRFPTLHASRPNSVPSTPRDGTRLKADMIE